MGWSLVPTSWFSTEYKQHFSDLSTYRRIDNFNCKQPTQSPTHYLANSKKRFSTIITNGDHLQLLDPTLQDKLQLPYMKLLLKVHKFDKPTSHK